jgi:hypothetical protein
VIWWTEDPSRFRAEREAIAELVEDADWLTEPRWRLNDGLQFVADFEIAHLGRSEPLSIVFPSFFPAVPPLVIPREEIRISGHQYGAGGELCLEYRTDNWEPHFTGAMMIQSARRLLAGETPSEGERAEVASAHSRSVAQEVRGSTFRLVVGVPLMEALASMRIAVAIPLVIDEHYYGKNWLAHVRRVGAEESPIWAAVPPLADPLCREGFAIRIPDEANVPFKATYDFVAEVLTALEHAPALERLASASAETPLLLIHRGVVRLYSLSRGSGSRLVFEYTTVLAPAEQNRLSARHADLPARSVAIVGCGSVGSKVAATLARAGVGTMVLVDGDLMLPGNLVRNELDWRSVGLDKPLALAARLKEINPGIKTIAKRLLLGGQESSESTDLALQRIGRCDLIVDATADAQIFNLCGEVARAEKKPLVWGEVFAGGIGGLVGRCRPNLDPPPHAARRQILQWCDDNGVPWTGTDTGQYDLQIDAEKPPLIADDADVSVIAAHVSRMAIDLLKGPDTVFPNSAYAIGLDRAWIFAAPFDAWPIDLVMEGSWGTEIDAHAAEALGAIVSEFFPKPKEAEGAG